MMRLALTPLFVAISLLFAGATVAMDKENTLYIDLKDGRVVIEMRPDLAPKHVAQIKKLRAPTPDYWKSSPQTAEQIEFVRRWARESK